MVNTKSDNLTFIYHSVISVFCSPKPEHRVLPKKDLSVDNILIRKLKAEDAGDITRIYTAITNKSAKSDFWQMIEGYAGRDENGCFVAEIDGRVAGYIISYILSVGFGAERSAWIPMVGVNPKFMGQGIGKQLAEETFRFYKNAGIREIYTSVRWDSVDLLSFFKTLEFDRSNFINLRKVLE